MSYMLRRTINLPEGVTIIIDHICALEMDRSTGLTLAVMSSGDKYKTGQTFVQFMTHIDAHVKKWEQIRATGPAQE